MKKFILEHDGYAIEASGQFRGTQEAFQLSVSYTLDNETIQLDITKDDVGYLIQEHSDHRQLYLALSDEKEEGYLRSSAGMIIFETQLLTASIHDALTLTYRLSQGDNDGELRTLKLYECVEK